jgi:DNA replication protein DnaC
MQHHPLLPKLKQLRLGGMAGTLELRSQEAIERSLAPLEFLALLLDDEIDRRDQKRFRRMIETSRLDEMKTLARFDFTASPWLSRTVVNDLASCRFIDKADNVLLAGPTGTGKSHLAQALGHEAIRKGKRVMYRPVHKILSKLHAKRADGGFSSYLSRLLHVELLILDDFGLVPLSQQNAEDLYEIIRQRYENRSIILTSNRSPEEWGDVFGNELMASAALDRLTHHSHFIEMKGESYRQKQRRMRSGKDTLNNDINNQGKDDKITDKMSGDI